MGPVGVQEMIVIFLVALVLFGPKKLPELGKTIGKAITEFRRAQSELKATFDHHMSELERENESLKQVTSSYNAEIQHHYDSTNYSDPYRAETYEATTTPEIASHPSTADASATQDAEPTPVSHETAGNGTVPRSTQPGQEHLSPETNEVRS